MTKTSRQSGDIPRSRSSRLRRPAVSMIASTAPLSRDDPLHLLGRRGLVDRHRDGAGGEDGVVDEQPLEAGRGHERHPVAGLDPGGDEALGEGADAAVALADREVDEGVVLADRHHRAHRLVTEATQHRFEQVRGRRELLEGSSGDLLHEHHPAPSLAGVGQDGPDGT